MAVKKFKKAKSEVRKMPNSTGLAHAGTVWADTGSHVPTRNDPPRVSSTTKTLLSGAPGQGQGSSPHSQRIHTHTHKCTTIPSSAACSLGAKHSGSPSLPPFLSLHLCLSQPLWGVCLSAERGDCSIAEKMYKMLSPLFC